MPTRTETAQVQVATRDTPSSQSGKALVSEVLPAMLFRLPAKRHQSNGSTFPQHPINHDCFAEGNDIPPSGHGFRLWQIRVMGIG
jgi:hypothetical protein